MTDNNENQNAGALAMFAKGGAIAKPGALGSALRQTLDEETSNGGGDFTYINFSGKTGKLSMGKDEEEIPADMVFLLDGRMTERGYICWKGRKPVGKVMRSIFEPGVAQAELPDHGPYNEKVGEGWKPALSISMIGDDGGQYQYTTTAISAKNSMADAFMDEMAERDAAGEPQFALISFTGAEQFEAQGQLNYKPTFDCRGWISEEEVPAWIEGGGEVDEPEPEPEPEPAPEPRARRQRRTRANAA